MAVLIMTSGASWQEIAALVLNLADRCRSDPHYIWIEKPLKSVIAVELERLLANLGLEDQWAYIDGIADAVIAETIVFDASQPCL